MICFKGVSKTFPGADRPVLENFSLTLARGTFCVVIGPNGSGKSTLLNMADGTLKPDKGRVECPPRIARVTQDIFRGTLGSATVLENMALALMRAHAPRMGFVRRREGEVRALLEQGDPGLVPFTGTAVARLSGGQRQRLATLMALATRADALLLDEHTSALDPANQRALAEWTNRKVQEQGITTLMVTHRMDEAARTGDRLLMLDRGRVVLDVQGAEKKAMDPRALLDLFHRVEDQTLLEEDA